MMVHTVILFTILASFAVFSPAQAGTANNPDYSQYTGEWLITGVATNRPQMILAEYGWINIASKGGPLDAYSFHFEIRTAQKEGPEYWVDPRPDICFARILINSQIRTTYKFVPLNGGSEMLFSEGSGTPGEYTLLLSRDSERSDEGEEALEQLAVQRNLRINFIDLAETPYEEKSEDAHGCNLNV